MACPKVFDNFQAKNFDFLKVRSSILKFFAIHKFSKSPQKGYGQIFPISTLFLDTLDVFEQVH